MVWNRQTLKQEAFDKILERMDSFWWKLYRPFRNLYRRTRLALRAAAYSWRTEECDWDYQDMLKLWKFKLDNMNTYLNKEGIVDADELKKMTKTMRICSKLLGRLEASSHAEKMYDRHDVKWGRLESRFEDVPGEKDLSTMIIWRAKANTAEEKAQEREEYKALYTTEEAMYNRDVDRLFRVFKKYHRTWWS